MKNLFKEAHKMTREIKRKYNDVEYKAQFSLCLSFLNKEGGIKLKELRGSEKQVNWANDIRKELLNVIDELEEVDNKYFEKKDLIKMIKSWEKKLEKIREEVRNVDSAKFFIDYFKEILKHNSLREKASWICHAIEDSTLEENRSWDLLAHKAKLNYRREIIKEFKISYEEAKEITKDIKFEDDWANEIKENVLEIVEIFDDAVKQINNVEEIEKTKEYIIETLIQENPQFYKNGFKGIKKDEIENYRNMKDEKRKIEVAYLLFKDGVEC
ncbi:hypothetical protein Q3304_08570 [Clostridioides sp. GD02377]|uniref:hypothetical protein n=1 Tax=unclassified Clostridioides TaxID=2635829 RepID=UPI00389D284D